MEDAAARTLPDPRYAAHAVGGILLGAALASIVQYFVPRSAWQAGVALLLATLCIASAAFAERTRGTLAAEAGVAAGLIAAGSVPFYDASPAALSAFAALLIVLVALIRRGRTPLALLAVPAFFACARHATGADMLRGRALDAEIVFLLALVAYAALMVRQRTAKWASFALAAQSIALAVATLPLLDALHVTDPGIAALGVGATLGLVFAVGLALHERPTVLMSGALLSFAALAFAFLAMGPALAAIVLLLLGAALVWQADALRGFMSQDAPSNAGDRR